MGIRLRLAREARGLSKRASLSRIPMPSDRRDRSEEHTSELQSRFDLVCRLPLEKQNGRLPPHGLPYLRLPPRRRAALARAPGLHLAPRQLDVRGRLLPPERPPLRRSLASAAVST